MKHLRSLFAWGVFVALFAVVGLLSVNAAEASAHEKLLHSFGSGTDGAYPFDTPIFDAKGNMYGTTWEGGTGGYGVVFEMSPTAKGGWTEQVLYNFVGRPNDGGRVSGGLVRDKAGNLYGTSRAGGSESCNGACGTVFELSPSKGTWKESVLYFFAGGEDGDHPYSGLAIDDAGNLYGTTHDGGANDKGTVFELSFSGGTWTKTKLLDFGGTAGEYPVAAPILDASGNLYGTTSSGGTKNGGGTAFELSNTGSGWTETILHNFLGGTDGQEPSAGLIFDHAGNLYGTTFYGGAGGCQGGCGTVFELSPSSGGWTETIIQNFTQDATGYHLNSGVIMGAKGKIYGTTRDGGNLKQCVPTGCGTVFEMVFSNGAWTRTRLYSFGGFNLHDGSVPFAGVVLNRKGHLIGTTVFGGANHPGTVYEVTP